MIRTVIIPVAMVVLLSFSDWHKANCDHGADAKYVPVDQSRIVRAQEGEENK